MARSDVTLNIDANLTPAQRKLQAFIQQSQRQLGSQSFAFKLDDRGFRQPLGRITGDLNQFQGAMDASIARTLAFGASVGAIAGVTKAFKDLVGVTVKVEHSLKEINVLLNLSTKDLKGFSKELFAVAKNTASSFDTVTTAATEFSRQGLSAAETAKRVNSALILTRLSGLDAEASVSALTAAVNGFKREAVSTTEVVNRLANVDAAFAVSSGDLAKALSRAGSVSQDAKVKFNELLAATTAVQQATARGGNVIGNGFKTIFTRLQRSKVREELEKIGVATTDSMGNMRGAISILKDYAKVYQTLSDQQKAYTSEQVAGVFQINTLKALVNDLSNEYGVYNRALAVANATTNEAVKRNAELNKTLQSLTSQTGTEIAELAAKVGAISFEGNFKGILGLIKSALGDVNKTIDSEGIGGTLARGMLKGFGDFLTGPGLAVALVGITRLLAFIGAQTKTALAQVFQIGTAAQKRQVVQQRINALLMEDNNLLSQIRASSGNINDINAIVSRNILAQNTALARQKLLVEQIAAGFALTKSGTITPIGGVGGGGPRRPSGRGAFGRGAQGFVPNMVRSERSSISRGVGGARGGDRPVVIPNFNFGGGKTGTMVAHTGEHIVPNFAQGGSAIFNRDMASSVGLPGGAVKVGAQGFVPNFMGAKKVAVVLNNSFTTSSGKHFPEGAQSVTQSQYKAMAKTKGLLGKVPKTITDKPLAVPDALQTLVISAKNLGVASALGQPSPTASPEQSAKALTLTGKAAAEKISLKAAGTRGERADKFDAFRLKGIQVRSLQTADDDDFGQKEFKNKISEYFAKPLLNFGDDLLGGIFEPQKRTAIANKLKEQDPADLFSSSAEGGIFESAIRVITRGMKVSKAFSKEKTPYFDFEERKSAQQKFKDAFEFDDVLYKADAKRTASSENIRTLVSKALGDKAVRTRFLRQPNVKEQIRRLNKKNTPTGRRKGGGAFGAGAEGFIPSFANLASVAASPAGKRAMATERALAGSSRMGYDGRVGYGVFNNSQGSLSNAVSQHMNAGDSAASLASTGAAAQGVSAAEGYVPSFVAGAAAKFIPGLTGSSQFTATAHKGILGAMKKGTAWFTRRVPKSMKKGGAQAAAKFDRGVSKILLASYAMSSASGTLQESLRKAEKDEAAARFGGAISGMTTGMTAGALLPFIPGGAGIGALIGGIVGLVTASTGIEKALVGLAKERLKGMEKGSKDQGDIAGYLDKVEKLKGAGSDFERVEAQRDIGKHLATMDPIVAANVRALGENTDAIRIFALKLKGGVYEADTALELRGAREGQQTLAKMAAFRERYGQDPGRRNQTELRREIETQGADARELATRHGIKLSTRVPDYKSLDPKPLKKLSQDLQELIQLEFGKDGTGEGWSANFLADTAAGVGKDAMDTTVGGILKDLGIKDTPEIFKSVLDKTLEDLWEKRIGDDATAEDRQRLEVLAALVKSTSDVREVWGKDAPIRAQKAADDQAEALKKRLESLEIDSPKIFGSVVRAEGRRVQAAAATGKFQDQLGKLRAGFIESDPDMKKQTKADLVQEKEGEAISRGAAIAADKQKVKFLGDILKAVGDADNDEDRQELEKILEAVKQDASSVKDWQDMLLGVEGDAKELLKDQIAALTAITVAEKRQNEILELNGLRQEALLEETRRQKVKAAIQSTSKNILQEGHNIRSAFFAITEFGDNIGKAFGPDLRAQQGLGTAYDVLINQLQGLVSADYLKDMERKRDELGESVAVGGIMDTLAPNLRKMLLESAGPEGFKNLDGLLKAVTGLIGPGGASALGTDQFKKMYADAGLDPKLQLESYKTLVDIVKEITATRGDNKKRAEFDKKLKKYEDAAEDTQRKTTIGKGGLAISAQVGVASLERELLVSKERVKETQKLIDQLEAAQRKAALGDAGGGSEKDRGDAKKELDQLKYHFIARLKRIPGTTESQIKELEGKELIDLEGDMYDWLHGQKNREIEIKKTIGTLKDKDKNLTANTVAINRLTDAVTGNTRDGGRGLGLPDLGNNRPPVPHMAARGLIPSMAVGGVANAMGRERRAILNRVGGAIPGVDTARLDTINGRLTAVNSGEKIKHNYRGSGQSAVLTRNMQRSGYARGYIPNMANGGRSAWWDSTPTQPILGVTTNDAKEFSDQMRSWHRYLELSAGAKTGTPDIDGGLPVGPLKPTPPRKSITVSNIQGAPPQVRGGGQPYSPRARPAPAPALPVKRIDDAMPSVDPSMKGKGFNAPRTRGFTDSVVQAPEGEPYYGIAGYRGGPDPSYIGKGMEPVYGKGDFEGSVKGKIIGSRPIGKKPWHSRAGREPVYGPGGNIIGSRPSYESKVSKSKEAMKRILPDIRDRDVSGMAARGYIPNMAGGATEAQLAELRAEADSVFKMLTQSMLRAGTLSQAELNAIPLPSKGADWELGDLRGGATFNRLWGTSNREGEVSYTNRKITMDRSKFTNSNLTRMMGNELYHYISSFQKGGQSSIATSKAMFEPEMREDGGGYLRTLKMKEMDPEHMEAVKRHILNQERSTLVAYSLMSAADQKRFTSFHGDIGFDMGGIYGHSSGTVGRASTRFREENKNLLMIRAQEAEEEASTAHDTMMNDQNMQWKYEKEMKDLARKAAKATAQPTAPPAGEPPLPLDPDGAPVFPPLDFPPPPMERDPRERPMTPQQQGWQWRSGVERASANRGSHEKTIANMRKTAAGLGSQMGSRQSQFGRGGRGFNRLPSAFNNAQGYIPNLSLGSEMVPNMSASNHFLNFAEGSVPAAATSAPAATSLAGAQTPGEALITQAKASQEKHNVNVNIEVYGNLSQDQVDQVQANGSDMATVLEELVNGGL